MLSTVGDAVNCLFGPGKTPLTVIQGLARRRFLNFDPAKMPFCVRANLVSARRPVMDVYATMTPVYSTKCSVGVVDERPNAAKTTSGRLQADNVSWSKKKRLVWVVSVQGLCHRHAPTVAVFKPRSSARRRAYILSAWTPEL